MANCFLFLGLVGCTLAPLALWQSQAAPPQWVPIAAGTSSSVKGTFNSEVAPVVNQFCVSCHSTDRQIAGVNLAGAKTQSDVLKQRDVWNRALRMVQTKHMPPEGLPAPTQAQRDRMTKWLNAVLNLKPTTSSPQNPNAPVVSCGILVPGRVTLRRLNREEYNNTVQDLTGVTLRPADDFPSDDVGYGFDNNGDVLSISPLLMEKYLDAAEKISQAAISVPQFAKKRIRGGDMKAIAPPWGGDVPSGGDDGNFFYYAYADAGVEYSFPSAGTYIVRFRGWQQRAGEEDAKVELRLAGKAQHTFTVSNTGDKPATFERRIAIDAPGKQRVSLVFTNDFYDEKRPEGQRDRNLSVEWMEIEGPMNDAQRVLPPSHKKIIFASANEIGANEDAAARKVVGRLARRAYRRPASPEDVERLMGAYRVARNSGETFEGGIGVALQAALVSPRFLFRLETDNRTGERALNSWELASRLSYFLWSSMPDEQLMTLASQDKLRDVRVLEAQVLRMMKSPKARALADNFAAQWFTLRKLSEVTPDPEVNTDWNDALRAAMKQETLLFFDDVVRNDRSVLEFLNGKWTYLNADLAKHYGIEGNFSDKWQRVTFDAQTARERSGVLTQGSVLTVTSNPTRTSPVKRGKWVMENFWGTEPPPPPPGVPELRENAQLRKTVTVRARLEEHRKNPECASCHKLMDPIGFSLENYDATGKWRDKDGELKIDISGALQGGEKFNGPNEFKALLMKRKQMFVEALSEKMLTYALGRGLTHSDDCYVRDISTDAQKNGYKFSTILLGVVRSKAFRTQGASADATAKTAPSKAGGRPNKPAGKRPNVKPKNQQNKNQQNTKNQAAMRKIATSSTRS